MDGQQVKNKTTKKEAEIEHLVLAVLIFMAVIFAMGLIKNAIEEIEQDRLEALAKARQHPATESQLKSATWCVKDKLKRYSFQFPDRIILIQDVIDAENLCKEEKKEEAKKYTNNKKIEQQRKAMTE